MIRIYESSDLVQLAELFSEKQNQQPAGNPLNPEQIIVQNNEIIRWLIRRLAENEGIAANLDFMFPADFFWKVVRMMNPNIPDQLPSDRGPMAWSIFQFLQSDDDPALSVLHQYTNRKESHLGEMRSWNLACRVSDVFDQYLLYRPEMLLAWEENQLTTGLDSERWQAHLWRKLGSQWQDKSEMHRARFEQLFVTAVESGSFPSEELPQRLTIFGKIDVAPSFFKIITQLGKVTDVDFYMQKIAAKQNHDLVRSFGQKAREFEEFVSFSLEESGVLYDRQRFSEEQNENRATFFNTLKRDIQMGKGGNELESIDPAFQIHSCHSPRREVEVLYNQLLFLMDNDEELESTDITIVCPQIEEYVAEIEGVFGAPEEDIPKIPFHISGVAETSDPVEAGFKKIIATG